LRVVVLKPASIRALQSGRLEQAKLLRQDLPVSRRIEIRETAKAAFEAGDDVLGKVRPFLKETLQEGTPKQRASKTIAVTP
jgi:hypothetical protein